MAVKLNSMRILEQHKIPYEVLEYDNGFHSAEEVAEMLELPYFSVYKTLVVEAVNDPSNTKPFLVLLPSQDRLSLKKLAKAAGVKKVKMASHQDAEAITGLQVGGISPLALKDKNWKVFVDRQIAELQHVVISAGQRGYQLRIPVTPLISLLRMRLVDVSELVD